MSGRSLAQIRFSCQNVKSPNSFVEKQTPFCFLLPRNFCIHDNQRSLALIRARHTGKLSSNRHWACSLCAPNTGDARGLAIAFCAHIERALFVRLLLHVLLL